MNLQLSLAIAPYEHTRDLRPRGIDLVKLELSVEEIFYRFTRFREWDASEMSFAKVTALLSEEKPDIVALPVFPSRVFRHSAIYISESMRDAVKNPKDLEGRRVGIPEWAQTAGIYVRGMLAEEHGVDLSKIDWHQAGVHQPGRVEKIELRLPQGIRITRHADKTLAGMLAAGEIDAAISARDPGGRRLFPNSRELEEAYFRKTRIFPIMHVVVLRRQAYERDRWIAMNLFTAFEEAKRSSQARLGDIGASQVPLPWIPEQVRAWKALAGEDSWPYGVEPNRPTLEAFFRWSHEQGVAKRLLKMEDVFAPETREQFKI
jgi:4,5-dihydroxyphthalate decarboxylase